jgi:hypothetical protein
MLVERPLPRLSAIKTIAMIVSAVIVPASFGLMAVHYQSHLLVVLSALVLIAVVTALSYLYFHRRRCPKCGGVLTFREEPIGDSKRARCLQDCLSCQITWDTGETYEYDAAA